MIAMNFQCSSIHLPHSHIDTYLPSMYYYPSYSSPSTQRTPTHPLSQTYFLHTFLQCTHLLNSHILPPPFFTHTPSLHPHTQNPFIFTPKHPPSSLPHALLPHLNPKQQELSELHSDELQQLEHSLRSEAESNLSQLRASLEREREEREEEQARMHKMEIEVERGGKKRRE